MRKSFIFVLAALLVVAFTAPVMAETKVEFSGSYRVRAIYWNNPNLQSDSDDEGKRSWLDQRFRMAIRFMPSENLTLNVNLEANDVEWGAAGGRNEYGTEAGNFSNAQDAGNIEMYYSYMAIKSAVGVFNFGRMPGGTDGLANLGYSAGPMGNGNPFDAEEPRDRFKWVLPAGPLTVIFVADKRVENDNWTGANGTRTTNLYDADRDTWALVLIYKFANGGVSGTVAYDRNRSRNSAGGLNPVGATAVNPQADSDFLVFDGALVLNFGPIGIHTEVQWLSGEMVTAPAGVAADMDLEGVNFYLDLTYNYGPGTIGAFYTYAQGDNTADNKNEAVLAGLGGDYTPFIIATDYAADGWGNAGIHIYGLWVDHSLTEDLMFSAALGFFVADAPAANVDDDYGTEIDLRLSYNLMANLTYEVTFGYFMAGDWHKGGVAAADVGNSWLLYQALTLSF
jgi:hypothetical protein